MTTKNNNSGKHSVDLKKFEEFMNLKSNNHTCKLCGKNEWTVSEEVYEVKPYRGGDLIIGGVPIIPVVPVTCSNCGNTMLINALVAGFINKDTDDGKGN